MPLMIRIVGSAVMPLMEFGIWNLEFRMMLLLEFRIWNRGIMLLNSNLQIPTSRFQLLKF
ncbi:MAG: hypothetical protein A2939_01065 [Parcubacteria group bacterium RIFCSPLOWO2_01_FULL_48_18]|nr:MAG: hypothetical protein A2939_01065 [Parcubacteria group bacterium RIFCSPLOWO2_01_FULL_48_18]